MSPSTAFVDIAATAMLLECPNDTLDKEEIALLPGFSTISRDSGQHRGTHIRSGGT